MLRGRHCQHFIRFTKEAEEPPVQPLADKLRAFYLSAVQPATNPIFSFDKRDLLRWAELAGLVDLQLELHTHVRPAGKPQPPMQWETFLAQRMWVGVPTYGECLRAALTGDEAAAFVAYLRPLVETGRGQARSQGAIVYLWGQKRETSQPPIACAESF